MVALGFRTFLAGLLIIVTSGYAATEVWESIPTQFPAYHLKFINADTGWALGDSATIRKTTNGGISWVTQFRGTLRGPVPDYNILRFANRDTGWIAGSMGTLLRTTDGGATWMPRASGVADNLSGLAFPGGSCGWAAGEGAILRTTNAGGTWSVRPSPDTYGLASIAARDCSIAWVSGNGKIWKTTDGGANWVQQIATGYSSVGSLVFPAVDTGWAASRNGGILSTRDGGTNWIQKGLSNTALRSVFFIDGKRGWVAGEEVSGPGGTLVRRTTDGGVTWKSSPTKGLTQAVFSLHFPTRDTGWALGLYGVLARTTDGGASWAADSGLISGSDQLFSLSDVRFADSKSGWVVGSNGLIRKTVDGGNVWQTQVPGDTSPSLVPRIGPFATLHFADASTGWVAGNGTVLKTTDGGSTWMKTYSSGKEFVTMQFLGRDTGWVAEEYDSVLFTSDGGLTWQTQATGHTPSYYSDDLKFSVLDSGGAVPSNLDYACKALNPNRVWLCKDLYSFIKPDLGWRISENGGEAFRYSGGTWTRVAEFRYTYYDSFYGRDVESYDAVHSIHFLDEKTGWIGGGGYKIWSTIDGGDTWISDSLPVSRRGVDIRPENGWLVTRGHNSGAAGLFARRPLPHRPVVQMNGPRTLIVGVKADSIRPAVSQGVAERFQIWPDIKAATGLSFDTATGVISGIPAYAAPATTYRLTALSPGGSASGDVRITVDPIGAVVPVSPAANASGVTVPTDLMWRSTLGASGYFVQVSSQSSLMRDTVVADTVLRLHGLAWKSAYFWRVRAVNGGGFGSWSSPMSFTTMPEPVRVEPVELLSFSLVVSPGLFRYTLPEASDVQIFLHDVSGKIIWSHRRPAQAAGRHVVSPETTLPNGNYIAVFRAGKYAVTRRVAWVR